MKKFLIWLFIILDIIILFSWFIPNEQKFDLKVTTQEANVIVTNESGQTIEPGKDVLVKNVTYTIKAVSSYGYTLLDLTVNGEEFKSGDTIKVVEDIEIFANSLPSAISPDNGEDVVEPVETVPVVVHTMFYPNAIKVYDNQDNLVTPSIEEIETITFNLIPGNEYKFSALAFQNYEVEYFQFTCFNDSGRESFQLSNNETYVIPSCNNIEIGLLMTADSHEGVYLNLTIDNASLLVQGTNLQSFYNSTDTYSMRIDYGTYQFKVTPVEGYEVTSFIFNGEEITNFDEPYVFRYDQQVSIGLDFEIVITTQLVA